MDKEKVDETPCTNETPMMVQLQLDEIRGERDELLRQIEQIQVLMTEKDNRMNELEQQIQETWSSSDKKKTVERQVLLRNLDSSNETRRSSSWTKGSCGTVNSVTDMMRKIEQIQKDITEVVDEFQWRTFLYEQQLRLYKEDFEKEHRDHSVTRNQLESMQKQWTIVYSQIHDKDEQLQKMSPKMEAIEMENQKLQEQLEQTRRHILMDDHHQKDGLGLTSLQENPSATSDNTTKEASTGGSRAFSESWMCHMCTLLNPEHVSMCRLCEGSRHHNRLVACCDDDEEEEY